MSLPAPFYQDASCTIYNGDCREILPLLPRFDLLLTDPPYGIGAARMTLGNGKRKLHRGDESWDDSPPSLDLLNGLIESCGNAVIWGGNYFGLGGTRCVLVWDKGTGDNDFADCELAWTNFDSVVKKYFKSWVGANAKDKGGARVHPTQKPVDLIRWCMRFAPNAQTILDSFMGSGTTLVAAKLEGRKAVGIEVSEKYCEIAANRLRQSVFAFDEVCV